MNALLRRVIIRRSVNCFAVLVVCWAVVGCETVERRRDEAKVDKPGGDSMVIRAGNIEQDLPAAVRNIDPLLAEAETFYQKEEYSKAERLFEKVASNQKNPPLVAEKARFYQAECKRVRGNYPDAMGTYNRLLGDFSYGVYREQAVAHMYEIARFWLEDTFADIQAQREREEGKRWFTPWQVMNFDRRKPTFDEEGNALKSLEQVYYNDPTGPCADKSLYLIGYVNYCRGNFREADQFLSQLIQMDDANGKRSKLRDQALELAILAKSNASGGPEYDGRKQAEALRLIHNARATSPTFVNDTEKAAFLDRQMVMIRHQQAEKEFQMAEYWRRTGQPASAWFYYELVRRRYPGTPFHDSAMTRMKELQTDLEFMQKNSFSAKTRRAWDEWMLGHESPTLQAGQTIPQIPGETSSPRDANPVVPVGGTDARSVPKDFLPR